MPKKNIKPIVKKLPNLKDSLRKVTMTDSN